MDSYQVQQHQSISLENYKMITNHGIVKNV